MESISKKMYDWAAKKVGAKHSSLWLGVVFLLEIFLFLPLDAILVLFCLENPQKRSLYVSIATVASTLSGILGFFLGLLAWDFLNPYVIGHLVSADFFNRICEHYTQYQSWAVFIGALIPLPFKVIALSAGVCGLNVFSFITSIFLARLLRFFLIAKATYKWGIQIKSLLDRHMSRFIFALGAKIALAFAFFWALGQG